MNETETTVAEVMDAHRVPGEMDAALARVRERMFASHVVAGHAVGRYVLIDKIGEGGMGSVVRAYDPRLQREVALKRLRSSQKADLRGRLLREARAMAKLHHPNVVSVYDVELIDDELVIAMEYVRGTDLRRWLRESRAPEEILRVFVEAGRGLGAAHAAGLVHRDFKPANALVNEVGRVQVTDFGLVRDANEDRPSTGGATDPTLDDLDVDQTSADIALGTPRYMAPEQESGKEIDRRADIYAFCVAVWEALAGEPPFAGDTLADLRFAKRVATPTWPKAVPVRPTILRALVRGLEPSPAERWPTMAALLSALEPRANLKRRWWLALPIAGAVAIPAVVLSTSTREPVCESDAGPAWAEDRPAVVQRLGEVDGAFADDVRTRTLATLDGFVDEWQTRRSWACDAERDAVARDIELACLQLGRVRLDSVVGVLTTVNSNEVPNAHRLVARLPDLSSCSDRESILARESRESAEIMKINSQLADSNDLYALGRYPDALREATAAMDAAAAAGFEALWIEARIQIGAVYTEQRHTKEALEVYRDSLSRALKAGEDRLAARAASLLGSVLATRGSSVAEGVTLSQLALDMAPQTQDTASWNAALYTNASLALSSAGSPDKAADLGLEALRVRREGGGANTPQQASTLNFTASSLCLAGRYDEGLVMVDDAVALTRKVLGEHHPQLAAPLRTRGQCRVNSGDIEGGQRDYREALAIFEAAFGPDDERVGVVLDNLGLSLAQSGEPYEAEEMMRRSLAIKTRLYDEQHLQLSFAQAGLAYALKHQGRFREAEVLFEAALQSRIANLGAQTLPVLHTYLGLAMCAIGESRMERATELLDEADRIADVTAEPNSNVYDQIDEIRSQLYN